MINQQSKYVIIVRLDLIASYYLGLRLFDFKCSLFQVCFSYQLLKYTCFTPPYISFYPLNILSRIREGRSKLLCVGLKKSHFDNTVRTCKLTQILCGSRHSERDVGPGPTSYWSVQAAVYSDACCVWILTVN